MNTDVQLNFAITTNYYWFVNKCDTCLLNIKHYVRLARLNKQEFLPLASSLHHSYWVSVILIGKKY